MGPKGTDCGACGGVAALARCKGAIEDCAAETLFPPIACEPRLATGPAVSAEQTVISQMFPRVLDEPCVVLHTRPYRENSLIVTVLSLNHGRVSMVAKGVRGGRRGRAIQPFVSAKVGWSGRSALATLTGFEVLAPYWFRGNVLACAFYLAELLVRLMGEREAYPRLFGGFNWALENIERDPALVLRSFEKLLLEELGYGLDFRFDVGGEPICDERRYRLIPDRGFSVSEGGYTGAALRTIGFEDFSAGATRQAAKSIFREALAHHLGPKPLLSRRLLVATP